MSSFRRKLYSRGNSYETTIPKPLLFKTNPNKKYEILFNYDEEVDKWYLEIVEEGKEPPEKKKKELKPSDEEEIKKIFEKNIKELLQEHKKIRK